MSVDKRIIIKKKILYEIILLNTFELIFFSLSLHSLQEGTIGEHLVMKPVPSMYRKHVQSTSDDEMFLDQEIENGDDQVSRQGFPLKSSKLVAHHKHVVYRRNPETDRNAGDYGKAFVYIALLVYSTSHAYPSNK